MSNRQTRTYFVTTRGVTQIVHRWCLDTQTHQTHFSADLVAEVVSNGRYVKVIKDRYDDLNVPRYMYIDAYLCWVEKQADEKLQAERWARNAERWILCAGVCPKAPGRCVC